MGWFVWFSLLSCLADLQLKLWIIERKDKDKKTKTNKPDSDDDFCFDIVLISWYWLTVQVENCGGRGRAPKNGSSPAERRARHWIDLERNFTPFFSSFHLQQTNQIPKWFFIAVLIVCILQSFLRIFGNIATLYTWNWSRGSAINATNRSLKKAAFKDTSRPFTSKSKRIIVINVMHHLDMLVFCAHINNQCIRKCAGNVEIVKSRSRFKPTSPDTSKRFI